MPGALVGRCRQVVAISSVSVPEPVSRVLRPRGIMSCAMAMVICSDKLGFGKATGLVYYNVFAHGDGVTVVEVIKHTFKISVANQVVSAIE